MTLSAFVCRVIDFLIGVGDQLRNPGEEPQAQAEDAVGEEPQDAVGEELKPEEREPIIPFQQAGVEAIHGLDGQGPKEVGKDIQDRMTNSDAKIRSVIMS
nr:hypothetical protein Iba_chr12bCG19310 [Ipomoea batatas]